MMMKPKTIKSNSDAFWSGFWDCFGVPAIGLGSSMLGFGAMAQASDLPSWLVLSTITLVWGLPGQVAMIEMIAIKANFLFVILTVSFANMRMLPLTVTGITVVLGGRKIFWLYRYFLAHFLAVTGWTAVMLAKDNMERHQRLYYYMGFSALLIFSGVCFGLIGYYGGSIAYPAILNALVFVTPLYLLLLVLSARHRTNLIAVIFGMVGGITAYPLIGDWAVLVAGLGGGSLAWVLGRYINSQDIQKIKQKPSPANQDGA